MSNVSDQNKRQAELDDFWDIDLLLPQKKNTAQRQIPTPHIETAEIEWETKKSASQEEVVHDAPLPRGMKCMERPTPTAPESPVIKGDVYHPHHPLISEVRILPWKSNFRFYERFCATAKQLYHKHGEPCTAVPFFSYMPQYDQMNRAQLSWYFYWRDCVRAGEYPETDYSYIFLCLFEIINLPDKIEPALGQRMMFDIWKNYRKVYPLLNRYLADWICDYSLIHHLPPPSDISTEMFTLIAEQSSFKEFYASPTGHDAARDAYVYLAFCTSYDYRKSKLYLMGEQQAKAMDTHIPTALSYVISALSQEGTTFAGSHMQKASLSRDSFIGALTSGRMKRRIEVDYCSFHRSHELRFLITDMIKYTENKLRGVMGMKSRLSIYALPDKIKSLLDEYLGQALDLRRAAIKRQQPERPAYELLYDLPKTELSPDHAAKIEQESWSMTKQLVEAFDQEQELQVPIAPVAEVKEPEIFSSSGNDLCAALREYAPFLRNVADHDLLSQRAFAQTRGCLPDALVEDINAIAADVMGDILIDSDDDGRYTLIEDYLQDVESLLQNVDAMDLQKGGDYA